LSLRKSGNAAPFAKANKGNVIFFVNSVFLSAVTWLDFKMRKKMHSLEVGVDYFVSDLIRFYFDDLCSFNTEFIVFVAVS
jgi:hypothetical protein